MAGRRPKHANSNQSIQIQDLDTLRRHIESNVFSTDIPDVITAFLDSRKILGRTSGTIRSYKTELDLFLEWLKQLRINDIDKINTLLIKTYIEHLWNTRNHGGVHAAYRVLRALCNWYKTFEDPDWPNPVDKIKVSSPPQDPLPGIPLEDVFRIANNGVSDLAIRDKAIFLTLVDSGMRANEMLRLNIENIDLMTGRIHVLITKNHRSRITFVSDEPRRLIRKYLKERGARDKQEPLFMTDDGKRLSYFGLVNLFRRRAVILDYQPMPHDFRRTFSLEMHRNGCDPTIRKILLGHRDSSVTARYLDFSERDLLEAHRSASPVANFRKKGIT